MVMGNAVWRDLLEEMKAAELKENRVLEGGEIRTHDLCYDLFIT